MCRRAAAALAAAIASFGFTTVLAAQEGPSFVEGAVVDVSGDAVGFAQVQVVGTARGTVADGDGTFRLGPLPPGDVRLRVTRVGYDAAVEVVAVEPGETATVRIALDVQPIEVSGIEVQVLRPDLRPQTGIEAERIREASPQDTGELLRHTAGTDAVRRGPLGLDPVIRGLRETQIGTYVDGTRVFPAGPARMDSPLSHFDPYAVSSLEVVKGPYALTWGGGNLTAIRVRSQDLPVAGPPRFGGRVAAGFETNIDASETMASVSGYEGNVAYWGFGAFREGSDYESGGDVDVPASFDSWEGRGKIGIDLAPGSRLTFATGFQDQGPIDFPGRLLGAATFEHFNGSVRWTLERGDGFLERLDALAYVNDVEHAMNNDAKPTARPMEGRVPPFALDIVVDTESTTVGGRVAATLDLGGAWEAEVGGDVYSVDRFADRVVARRDDGTVLFEDLIWPDATITDAGVFGRLGRTGGPVRWSGTVRVDFVHADADTIGPFFAENVSPDLSSDETNVSAAATAGLDVHPNWTLSLGLGSAVRTAAALERFSDRFPSTRFQASAEFMGDPDLEPERSTQFDAWLEGAYARASFRFNVWARWVDDWITIAPTDFPKRLPLSPDVVFQYVNGEANFTGFEASATLLLTDGVTLRLGLDGMEGDDETLDEPALGVPPLEGAIGLRYDAPRGRWFAEGTVRITAEQDEVAERRFEGPTDGYTVVDLRAGYTLPTGVELRVGFDNLFDEEYVNHLNARNPFTGEQVPEPGQVLVLDASVTF